VRDALVRATRAAHLWLPGYLGERWRRRRLAPPRHVWVTIGDHFEPQWKKPDLAVAVERVARWRKAWPEIAARHADASGRPAQYGFFFPQEEYRPELIEPLAEMARQGVGDVEIHIHHDGGGEAEFLERMGGFIEALHERHGLLRRHEGQVRFGFIHGNWALDNSRPDRRWCGLDNEITLLRQLGCYADFTMPAAPSPCQAGPVNTVYRVADDPARPRSYAAGRPVVPGGPAYGDLTLIPGPLVLDFEGRSAWKPRVDTGELGVNYPPSVARTRSWIEVAPRIEEHVFVKLFAHGAQERHSEALLGSHLDALFSAFETVAREAGLRLHYVTAWEMWLAVEALRLRQNPLRAAAGDEASQLAGRRAD
jgi:hypothetical protein